MLILFGPRINKYLVGYIHLMFVVTQKCSQQCIEHVLNLAMFSYMPYISKFVAYKENYTN